MNSTQDTQASAAHIHERHHGYALHIRLGQIIVLTLAESITAPTRWRIAQPARTVLALIQDGPAGYESERIGGEGQHFWRFATTTTGRDVLCLQHQSSGSTNPFRPFEISR